MKHSTLFAKSLLMAMALGATTAAQAQEVFKYDLDKSRDLAPDHRYAPAFGDFNNDGWIDIYHGGQAFEQGSFEDDGTTPRTPSKWAYYNAETDSYEGIGWWTTGRLYVSKGAAQWDVETAWPSENGKWDASQAHGIYPSTFGIGRWFDFNNDGNLDLFMNGQDEWGWKMNLTNSGNYTLLFRNKGQAEGYQFECVGTGNLPLGNNEIRENAGANNSSVSFGDYDHDGYTDILIQCYRHWMEEGGDEGAEELGERHVGLYRNNGDGTFTLQEVFNPIPYAENPNPQDLFEADVETESMVPNHKIKAMSHGAAILADLNNDGWLDVITTGWANDCIRFYIYKNNGDGTFQEVDMSGKPFVGIYRADIAVADVNNDGWLDIVAFGEAEGNDGVENGEGGYGEHRRGDVYLNTGDGEFNFTLSSSQDGNGLVRTADNAVRLVDLNHDGLIDIVMSGEKNRTESWSSATRVFYQDETGLFSQVQELRNFGSGGWEIADLNGDGAIDLIGGGYGDNQVGTNGTYMEYYAGQETEDIENPDEPTDVKATQGEAGKLTVSFTGGSRRYAYNVYVRNKQTGWISQIVPADIETGHLKAFHSLQTLLHSDDPSEMAYTISVPDGDYEVGVQTVKNDWTTSAFAKAEVSIASGIQQMQALPTQATRTYDALGRTVPAAARGLYIVRTADGQVRKVLK